MRYLAVVALAALTLSAAPNSFSFDCVEALAEGRTVVTFDHATGGPLAQAIRVGNGEQFWVLVRNTEPAAFTYSLIEVKLPAPQSRGMVEALAPRQDVCLTAVHGERYGGYVVRIIKQAESTLTDAVLVINVDTSGFRYEIAGGFTVATLTDPVYTVSDGVLVRVPEAEDTARLGFGGFITTYHSEYDWLGATFGLGLDSDGATRYYAGPSFRFGDTAAITVGAVWGPVERLPLGLSEGDALEDVRLLEMESRITGRMFFAISYSFVGWGGTELVRPFAE